MTRRIAGFSLPELLVTLTIIAVLLAMAVPAWQQSLAKARRSEALQALAALSAEQELFRLAHGRYALGDELRLVPPAGLGHADLRNYRVSLRADPSGYVLQATSRSDGRQSRDAECRVFTVDAVGRQQAHDDSGRDRSDVCWPD